MNFLHRQLSATAAQAQSLLREDLLRHPPRFVSISLSRRLEVAHAFDYNKPGQEQYFILEPPNRWPSKRADLASRLSLSP